MGLRACPSLVLLAKTVADAGFRKDVMGLVRLRLDFLAQLPHIDPQILDVRDAAPHLPENVLVGG